jgi:hypothetical protein
LPLFALLALTIVAISPMPSAAAALRLTVMLRREGWRVNAKRIYRLCDGRIPQSQKCLIHVTFLFI